MRDTIGELLVGTAGDNLIGGPGKPSYSYGERHFQKFRSGSFYEHHGDLVSQKKYCRVSRSFRVNVMPSFQKQSYRLRFQNFRILKMTKTALEIDFGRHPGRPGPVQHI
jgi:hypothetical protein